MKSTFVIFTSLFLAVRTQNFGFPELAGQRLDSESKNGRFPLYIPGLCPENQLLYPGDQKSDWICDCSPGYIYHPAKDACFAAYRKGPCDEGHHLILKKNEIIPECTKNSCKDGFVKFDGKCYQLDKEGGPCEPIMEGGGIFGVNSTTLELECLKGTDRLSLFELPTNYCPRGSQRDRRHKCGKVIKGKEAVDAE